MRLTGSGIIIIEPNPVSTYSHDKYYKYRHNSDIFYFSGVRQQNTIIVLDIPENKSYLFLLDKNPEKEQWYGRRIDHQETAKSSGFMMIYPRHEFSIKIADLLDTTNILHYRTENNHKLDHEIFEIIDDKDIQIENPSQRFDTLRVIKDEYEIDSLKKAISITVDAHLEAIQMTRPNMTEYELEAIYDYHYRINGARMPMHETIVAAGENGIYLHHKAEQKEMVEDELVLVDTGCEYYGYTADVARTWPVSGKFTLSQKELYKIVLDTHKQCLGMVKPGIKYWDIHNKAVELLTNGLRELGLLQGDIKENIENENYRRFFMHGIGHFLGLDGHDCSSLNREEVVLQPGMVLTIEPGLYIPDDDDIPQKYRDIGIRIEDNVLVTTEGSENLSESLPIEIEDIEDLVGSSIGE